MHGLVRAEPSDGLQLERHDIGNGDRCRPATADQLSQQQASRPGTKNQSTATGLHFQRFQSMHEACRRFGEHGAVPFEALHREDLPMISGGVLGKESGPVHTHAFSVGAPNELAGQAILTMTAVDVGVDRHQLPRAKACDIAADLIDLADRLVPRCERIDADGGPLIEMQIGATHPGLNDLDPNVEGSDRWHGHVGDRKVARRLVTDGLSCFGQRDHEIRSRHALRNQRRIVLVGRASPGVSFLVTHPMLLMTVGQPLQAG